MQEYYGKSKLLITEDFQGLNQRQILDDFQGKKQDSRRSHGSSIKY